MTHSHDSHDVEHRNDPRRPDGNGAEEHSGASRAEPRQDPAAETSWTTGSPGSVQQVTNSPMAVTALVLGLLALFCVLPAVLAPLAILLGIVAIVFGILGRKQAGQPHRTGKGLATAGLVMGTIALVLGILAGIALTLGAMNPDIIGPVQQQFGEMMT
ncbi:DUF4190 domain-containing protein [Saccharopolyspora sp. MS10]|uniref:DUF4190 domain-containing protein n=1 Tax=Saccharopolyspora sp. MS10 TaxID=3385973 RepID=UPI0039A3B3BD